MSEDIETLKAQLEFWKEQCAKLANVIGRLSYLNTAITPNKDLYAKACLARDTYYLHLDHVAKFISKTL